MTEVKSKIADLGKKYDDAAMEFFEVHKRLQCEMGSKAEFDACESLDEAMRRMAVAWIAFYRQKYPTHHPGGTTGSTTGNGDVPSSHRPSP